MSHYSDEDWESLIEGKITEVHSDLTTAETPFTHITSASDPSFPLTVDHTLLKPDATSAQIDRLCDEAIKCRFKSCCVNGRYVEQVTERLKASSSITCCVVGFPLGAGSTESIVYEAQQAITSGASEIDTVLPLGLLKSRNFNALFAHLNAIVVACSPRPVKVILETVFLSPEEIISASFIAAEAGAAFVKTCTGFQGGKAEVRDVSLMWRTVRYKGGSVKVKASGGVRSFEACVEMLKAGAERIGTSSGASIMEQVTPNTEGTY